MSREHRLRKNSTLASAAPQPRRRPLIGGWTIAAGVVGLVVLWGHSRISSPPPVILPSQVVSAGGVGWRPDSVAVISASSAALHLTEPQQKRLADLADSEARAQRPLEAQINADWAQFGTFVRSATRSGGASIDELKKQGAPLIADSNALSRLRQRFWDRAMGDLSASQRAAAPHILKTQRPTNQRVSSQP